MGRQRAKNNELRGVTFGVLACQFRPLISRTIELVYIQGFQHLAKRNQGSFMKLTAVPRDKQLSLSCHEDVTNLPRDLKAGTRSGRSTTQHAIVGLPSRRRRCRSASEETKTRTHASYSHENLTGQECRDQKGNRREYYHLSSARSSQNTKAGKAGQE